MPPVHLVASNAYDPQGDGQEHDEEVPNATDGDPATYWETEDYRGSVTFGSLKDGVGIVFDAGRPVKLGSLTVVSDTPGYVARVEAGSSSTGPFDDRLVVADGRAEDLVQALGRPGAAVLPPLDHAARARLPAQPRQRGDGGLIRK